MSKFDKTEIPVWCRLVLADETGRLQYVIDVQW